MKELFCKLFDISLILFFILAMIIVIIQEIRLRMNAKKNGLKPEIQKNIACWYLESIIYRDMLYAIIKKIPYCVDQKEYYKSLETYQKIRKGKKTKQEIINQYQCDVTNKIKKLDVYEQIKKVDAKKRDEILDLMKKISTRQERIKKYTFDISK